MNPICPKFLTLLNTLADSNRSREVLHDTSINATQSAHACVLVCSTMLRKILSNKFLKNITDFSVSIHVLYMPFDLLSTTFFKVFSNLLCFLFCTLYTMRNSFLGADNWIRTSDLFLTKKVHYLCVISA